MNGIDAILLGDDFFVSHSVDLLFLEASPIVVVLDVLLELLNEEAHFPDLVLFVGLDLLDDVELVLTTRFVDFRLEAVYVFLDLAHELVFLLSGSGSLVK